MSVVRLEERPKLGRLYFRTLTGARGHKGDSLPDLALELPDSLIDRANLADYADVCGFRQSDGLPPTYPHLLGFPLAMTLMVNPSFPFALPGLIHVANRISQRRPISADERLTVRVRAAELRPHPRGRQFDMITEATAAGEPVWTESSTYLRLEQPSSREGPHPDRPPPAAEGKSGPHPDPPQQAGQEKTDRSQPTAIWRVPGDIGRRYAAVSGDINPIHLNPLAARLFGFRRAIAHGMWVQARCLAALEGRLPAALTVEIAFKSPLLLPSTAGFAAGADDGTWSFTVFQPKTGRPHLVGTVKA
jgi:acyl dehydratase